MAGARHHVTTTVTTPTASTRTADPPVIPARHDPGEAAAPSGVVTAAGTVAVRGVGDRETAEARRQRVEALAVAGAGELSVDLAGLDRADRCFVRVLARLATRLRDGGPRLRICGLSRPQPLATLGAAALRDVFAVYRAACHPAGAGPFSAASPPAEVAGP